MAKPMYALFTFPTSVHAICGVLRGTKFISDRPHLGKDDPQVH